jgi:ELWxxDGT repeat protein
VRIQGTGRRRRGIGARCALAIAIAVTASLAAASFASAATHQAGMVKDINPGPVSASPLGNAALNFNGTVYFTADDGTHGDELWKSDGTDAGTSMVRDIRPGPTGSDIFYLTVLNDTIYFTADDGSNGFELWKTNGTEAGTQMVVNLNPSGSGCCSELIKANDTLYMSADDGSGQALWKSDGTALGTELVDEVTPADLTDVGGTVYFRADDVTSGVELWSSDGTEPGTSMVMDINPSGDSFPDSFTDVGGTLYFSANDGTNGSELWTSDGTDTTMVENINSSGSALSCCPPAFTAMNGVVFFSANDGINGEELWTSNGTELGTTMVEDINQSGGSGPGDLRAVGDTLYFAANDGVNGREPWTSDGTETGTAMLKDIHPSDGSFPYQFTEADGSIFFGAEDATHGRELWESDGTAAGTELVRDINPDSGFSTPNNLIDVNGTLFFSADDGTNGAELWRTFEDTTAPTGGAITTNLPVFRLTTPFAVAWGSATDSGGSGVASYRAYAKTAPYNGAFASPTLFKTTSAPGGGSFQGMPGNTYCFNVRVADTVGNTSAPSAQRCTSLPVDDPVLGGAGWTRRTGKFGYYRGSYSQSSTRGALLTLPGVQAKRLALVATTCPGCGSVQVFQGTTLLKQMSLSSANVDHRIIPIATFGSVHTGTVKIRVATSGKPVIVDGLGVSRL